MFNLKEKIVNWLLHDITIEELHTRGIRVSGGNTLYVDIWDWDHNTADPSTTESLMWYNSTDSVLRYYDGTSVVDIT